MGYIYTITNILNGKQYVGKTEQPDPYNRFLEHRKEMNRDRSNDRPLYRAMRKHGFENFKFEIVYSNLFGEELDNKEIELIEQLDTYGSGGYNATIGGEGRQKTFSKRFLKDSLKKYGSVRGIARHISSDTATIQREMDKHGIKSRDVAFDTIKKPVIREKTGQEFPSITEASEFIKEELSLEQTIHSISTGIGRVCKGSRGRYLGEVWRYV